MNLKEVINLHEFEILNDVDFCDDWKFKNVNKKIILLKLKTEST